MTPSEIAKVTRLTSGSTTALIDRLELNGLVERLPDEADRRRTFVCPKLDQIEQAMPHMRSYMAGMAEIFAPFSDEQLTIILSFMEAAALMSIGALNAK